MPHKSKKRKIISDYRRRLKQLHQQDSPTSISFAPKEREKSPVHAIEPPKLKIDTELYTKQRLQIKKDLSKTVVLSVLAIFAEFVLYLLTRS